MAGRGYGRGSTVGRGSVGQFSDRQQSNDRPGVHSKRGVNGNHDNIGKTAEFNSGAASGLSEGNTITQAQDFGDDLPEAIFQVKIQYRNLEGLVDLGCSKVEYMKWWFLFNNPSKLKLLLIELEKKQMKVPLENNYPPVVSTQMEKNITSDDYMAKILKTVFLNLIFDLEAIQLSVIDDGTLEDEVQALESEIRPFERDLVIVCRDPIDGQSVWIIGLNEQVQSTVQSFHKLKENKIHQPNRLAQSNFVSKLVQDLDHGKTDKTNTKALMVTNPVYQTDGSKLGKSISKSRHESVPTNQGSGFRQEMRSVKITPFQAELVESLDIECWLKELFPSFRFSHTENEISVSGPEMEIASIQDCIDQYILQIERKSKCTTLTDVVVKMLSDESVYSCLIAHLRKSGLVCLIKINEYSVKIYAKQSDEVDHAIEIVKGYFVDDFIHLHHCCLGSTVLKHKQCSLKEKYKAKFEVYEVKADEKTVEYHFVSTNDIAEKLQKEFKNLERELMKKNAKHISASPLHVQFLQNNFDSTLDDLVEKYNVVIKPASELPGLDVHGPAECVKQVEDILTGSILKEITSKDMHIASQKAMGFIQGSKGVEFLQHIGKENMCAIEQELVSVSTEASSELMFQSGIVQSTWKFDGGSEIKLMLVNCKEIDSVEVIVRLITYKDMEKALRSENRGINICSSKQYKELRADVPVPEFKDGKNKDKENLRKQFETLFLMITGKNIGILLAEIKTTKWKKVSFAKQILYALQEVIKDKKNTVKMIFFESKEEDFMSVLAAMKTSLGDKEKSGTAIFTQCSESRPVPPKRHRKKPSERTNLHVTVQIGQLAHQSTDVLVNTTSHDLKLHGGAVSTSILKAAGDKIQTECESSYPDGIQYGEVAVTKGYRLNCTYVYHGCLPSWTGSKLEQLQMRHILKTFVTECLYLATEANVKSISFPAMGTGNLGFPKDLVAKDMFSAVYEFESNLKGSLLKLVQFVIYEKDTATIKEFEKEEHFRKNLRTDMKPVEDYFLPNTDTEEILQLNFGRITVALGLGDVTRHHTMGLVVIWDSSEIFRGLPERMKYLINAGRQWESKKANLYNLGAVVTDADGTTYTKIIHVKADKSKLNKLVSLVLQQAEFNFLASVAVPIQRKDPLSDSLEKFANAWLKAVKEFEKNRKTKYLRFIRLVFERDDMMETFRKILDEKHQKQVKRQGRKQDHPLQAASASSDSDTTTLKITVTGNNNSNFDGAFNEIENKIKQLHDESLPGAAQKTEMTAKSNILEKKDENYSEKMPDNQKDHDSKEQFEELRANKHPDLQMTDDVDCCVIASKPQGMTRGDLDKLKLLRIQFTVIHPYQDDMHALIICKDSEGAEKFIGLKKVGDVSFAKMDPQVLFNISAEVDTEYLQGIPNIKQTELKDHVISVSGVKIDTSDGGWTLSGLLPQIEIACNILQQAGSESNGTEVEAGLPMQEERRNIQQDQPKDTNITNESDKLKVYNGDTNNGNGDRPTSRKDRKFPIAKSEKENQIGNENAAAEKVKLAPNSQGKRVEDDSIFKTTEGLVVRIYQCDITVAEVSCIVNAANCKLEHGGGLAKVIAQKAGKQFVAECKSVIDDIGQLEVGYACSTSGGNLNYPFIIHTVGPSWDDYDTTRESEYSSCCQYLQFAVISAILEAEKLQLDSVALPPISAGTLGVPVDTCIRQYPLAVLQVSKMLSHQSHVKEIHFVADDIAMVFEMKRGFSDVFSRNNSEATFSNNLHQQDVLTAKTNIDNDPDYPKFCQHQKNQITVYEAQFNAHFSVHIYTGDILKAEVDGLACGQDENLQNIGDIARTIHITAGPDYHLPFNKMKKAKPYHLGQVLRLKPEKPILSGVSMVFQAVTFSWTGTSDSVEGYLQGISKCFIGVLKGAANCSIKRLALPLFGTGNEGADFNKLASLLLDNILTLLEGMTWPDCSLREVHIVNKSENATVRTKSIFQKHIEGRRLGLKADKRKMQESRKQQNLPGYKSPSHSTTGNKSPDYQRVSTTISSYESSV